MEILALQFIMVLVAFISAKEEVYATHPYRMNVAPKGEASRLYHKWGFLYTALVCIIVACLAFIWTSELLIVGALIVLNSLWYWLLFDILYAKFIGQPWYYLGAESGVDRMAKSIFGSKRGGVTKAIVVAALILAINIICIMFVV
jgi:hypothetical protein